MKYLLALLLVFAVSCSQDFSKPHYRKPIQSGNGWKRRNVNILKHGTYRNPTVKKEAKRKMLQPPEISFDKW
jgi:hypothetical protein